MTPALARHYVLVCTALGLVLGWLPWLVHGPHPMKFAVLHVHGQLAVWAFYSARLAIGFLVGISVWPARWWLRGPLCGLVSMWPVALVALATPECGVT